MAATIIDGPEFVYGNLGNIEAGVLSPSAVPDPNQDAGPSMFFQGDGLLDPRILFLKDKVQGYTGVAAGWLAMDIIESARTIPAAASAVNIAAAQTVTTGVPMTLAAANVNPGLAVNIPVRIFSPVVNGGVVQTGIALDYGFGYGTAAAGNTTITVGVGWDYFVGMPLCISGAGNAGGTLPLLTFVTAVNGQANTIVVNNAPLFSGTVAIGTGDMWGPSEANPSTGGYPIPLAAAAYLANGPALMLDSRQALTRGLRITGVASGTGGNFLIAGADKYGMPMSQLLAGPVGAATTWTSKNFGYIFSITPQFTDAHNYSVGTADQFGFAIRSTLYEDMAIFFAATWMSTTTGYVAAVLTQPATPSTGDVRGSLLVGTANSAGAGFGANLSNGSLTGIVLTGNRLEIGQQVSVAQAIQAEQITPYYLTGVTQA